MHVARVIQSIPAILVGGGDISKVLVFHCPLPKTDYAVYTKLPISVGIHLSDLDPISTSGGADVIRLCLDFLTSMATYIHQNNLAGSYAHNTLEHFLQVCFLVSMHNS